MGIFLWVFCIWLHSSYQYDNIRFINLIRLVGFRTNIHANSLYSNRQPFVGCHTSSPSQTNVQCIYCNGRARIHTRNELLQLNKIYNHDIHHTKESIESFLVISTIEICCSIHQYFCFNCFFSHIYILQSHFHTHNSSVPLTKLMYRKYMRQPQP